MTATTQIRERPILFSAPMVRAILNGRKTQTRRVVMPQPKSPPAMATWSDGKLLVDYLGRPSCIWPAGYVDEETGRQPDHFASCPYGTVGDRLWVKEPFNRNIEAANCYFRADNAGMRNAAWRHFKDKPESVFRSIYLPHRFSRITLEITGVRVERVQEITESDAESEGFTGARWPLGHGDYGETAPSEQFRDTWDTLNAKRGFGWDANPWVWVIEFKRLEQPQ